jgi:hypothetical protein
LVPEHDDFLNPAAARERFAPVTQFKLIPVKDAKHLWIGEPFVYIALTEIVKIIAPEKLPLPLEIW